MNDPTTTESPATFDAVLTLLKTISDAPACKARTLELQRQTDALAAAQTKLSAEVSAVTRRSGELDTRSEQLDRREADIRRRETAVFVREGQLEETAKLRGVPFDPKAAQPFGPGGGMTREVDPDEGKPLADAHFREVLEPTFEAPAQPAIQRARHSMRRIQP
jgi:hypothetical protein